MHPRLRATAAGAVLSALALFGSDTAAAQEVVAHAEGEPTVDYDAYWGGLPEQMELGKQCLELAKKLHDEMDALAKAENDPEQSRKHRAAVRSVLQEYRAKKARQVALLDRAMRTPPPVRTDRETLTLLRDTQLLGVTWNKRKFIDCLRDIAAQLRVRFLMHPNVLKFNTVEMDFPQATADSILRTICSGFECDYIVYNGEIIVIKSIKRNDERLDRYLREHPDWKYWLPEERTEVEDDL